MQGMKKKPRIKHKKLNFKKQHGNRLRREIKNKVPRKQENLHKLLPSVLIQVNDRVRVKGRYNGTVKYVGRLEGVKSSHPEIYVGVQLDEPVTKSSGVYKNCQYFDCPFGYGIMIPYSSVQKINRVKGLVPEMGPPSHRNSLEKTQEPYSIKRWKSATDLFEVDLSPPPMYGEKKIKVSKSKKKDKSPKRKPIPDMVELSPPTTKRPQESANGVLNMWKSRADNPNIILGEDLFTLCKPNPYPSSSALQQSFAMICDTYSSSDSGFGECFPAEKDRTEDRRRFEHARDKTDDSVFSGQNDSAVSGISIHRYSGKYNRAQSLPRNLHQDIDDITSEKFIQARRTFPKTLRESFDHEGYYISRGAIKMFPDQGQYVSPELYKLSPPKSLVASNFADPIVRSNYQVTQHPRSRTVIDVEVERRKKKERGRSKKDKRRRSMKFSGSSNELRNDVERPTRHGNIVRARSVGEGLGRYRQNARSSSSNNNKSNTVSKKELLEWRKKFGENNAVGMMGGLQKLQDAFQKGMSMKETYGYPTEGGRYIKVAK